MMLRVIGFAVVVAVLLVLFGESAGLGEQRTWVVENLKGAVDRIP